MRDSWGRRRIYHALIGWVVVVLGLGGCTASLPPLPAPTAPPPVRGVGEEARQAPTPSYTLGPGDTLRVGVYDNLDLSSGSDD